MRLILALSSAIAIAAYSIPAAAQSVQPVRGAVKGTGQVAKGVGVGTAQVAKGAGVGVARGTTTAAKGTARGFRCIFTLGARC